MDTRRVTYDVGSVEDDHRAKSIGLEPTDYGLKG